MKPFTQLNADIQKLLMDRINQRWGQLYELEKEYADKALKYLMLTNSGGAIAILGFLGASERAMNLTGIRIALSMFVLGILLVGVSLAKQYHHRSRLFTHWKRGVDRYLKDGISWECLRSEDDKRAVATFVDYLIPYSSFICFIGGCIAGAVSLFG